MAARLVALERELVPGEDHRRAHVLRAGLRGEQRDRLLRDARRVADEIPLGQALPAAAVLEAKAVGVRADLELAVAGRLRRDAAAALAERLRDLRALRREEELLLALDRVAGSGRAKSRLPAERRLRVDEESDPLLERQRERVDVHRRRVLRDRGLDVGKDGVRELRERARLRQLDGEGRDAIDLRRRRDLRRREAPATVGDRADAEAERLAAVDGLDPPVLHERVLGGATDEADVRVPRSSGACGVQRSAGELPLVGPGHSLTL